MTFCVGFVYSVHPKMGWGALRSVTVLSVTVTERNGGTLISVTVT